MFPGPGLLTLTLDEAIGPKSLQLCRSLPEVIREGKGSIQSLRASVKTPTVSSMQGSRCDDDADAVLCGVRLRARMCM